MFFCFGTAGAGCMFMHESYRLGLFLLTCRSVSRSVGAVFCLVENFLSLECGKKDLAGGVVASR